MRRLSITGLLLLAGLCLAVGTAAAKDEGATLQQRLNQLSQKVAQLKAGVDDLDANYAQEIDERDRLMLRKRFVEGREFFYELHDYRGASEVFYGIVNHPLATTLPNINEAVFYLAEALFHSKNYAESKVNFERVLAKGKSDYYAQSLMRLTEIAVIQKNYAEAERLYSIILSEFKEGEDGSLGRYIVGKSYYLRGEPAKAVEIFDSIPEDGAYYATAQYYAAVLFVKQNNFREAVNRLRNLKRVLRGDVANKKELFSLTNLALARIYYEMNDFPQAMANYVAVPEGEGYADALYESIWVYITRNDYLLKAIEDERGNYENVLFDFTEFRDAVDSQSDQESLKPVSEQSDQLEGELDNMKTMFDDIDKSLVRLQQDAINSFNKLAQSAPNSPLLPDAELLAGNIYAQAEDFQTAQQWFVRLKKKYEDFYASIAATRPRLEPVDYINMVQSATASAADGAPLAPSALKGVPPEAAYWLAVDKDVRRVFAMYDAVSKERDSVVKMRELVADIQRRLNGLERGTEYPILREAHRRTLQYGAEIQTLQVELSALRNDAGQAKADAPGVADINAKTGAMEASFQDMQSRLAGLNGKIEAKKKERLAYFRRELASLRAPIGTYDRSIQGLLAQAGGELADVAAREMAEIERQVNEYAQRADLGIIDVAWRATRGSSRDIKKIQQQMEKELREIQRLHNQPQTEQPPAEDKKAPKKDEKNKKSEAAPPPASEPPPPVAPPSPPPTPPSGGQ